MTRVRVVSLRSFDPVVNNLSPRAFRAWQKAIDWCVFHGTDGFLTPKCIKAIGATPADQKELSEAFLWHREEDGRTLVLELRNGPPAAIDVEGSEVKQLSPGAKRQREWRARKRNTEASPARRERDVSETQTGDAGETSPVVSDGSPLDPPPIFSSLSVSSPLFPESSLRISSDPKDLTGSARDSEKPAKSGRKRNEETPFPDDFSVTKTETDLAEKLGLREPWERDQFRDKALAHGWVAKDWRARYRTWLRKAQEFASSARPPGAVAHEKTRQDENARPYHGIFEDTPEVPAEERVGYEDMRQWLGNGRRLG